MVTVQSSVKFLHQRYIYKKTDSYFYLVSYNSKFPSKSLKNLIDPFFFSSGALLLLSFASEDFLITEDPQKHDVFTCCVDSVLLLFTPLRASYIITTAAT